MIRHVKRYTLFVIFLLLVLILALFVFINVRPYSKLSDFQSDINEVYNNIDERGEKFVFVGDSLISWSVNNMDLKKLTLDSSHISFLPNGIYLKKTTYKQDTTIVYLYLIKNDFAHPNHYIKNTYNTPFKLTDKINITTKKQIIG